MADTDLGASQNNWEEELKHAMEEGGDGVAFPFQFDPVVAPVTQSVSIVLPPSASIVCPPSASVVRPPSVFVARPPSASVALPVNDPDTATAGLLHMSVTAPMTSPAAAIIAVSFNPISSAMEDFALTDDSHAVEANVVGAIPPKPRPKPRRKAKADELGTEVHRSGCKK